mmetsp:Transcript_9055/g.23336  ORF Transcript_9055/g.23336 Transcript_9055/m.23336 type:complete len:228 (+) Transcript_9055:205-888(+)
MAGRRAPPLGPGLCSPRRCTPPGCAPYRPDCRQTRQDTRSGCGQGGRPAGSAAPSRRRRWVDRRAASAPHRPRQLAPALALPSAPLLSPTLPCLCQRRSVPAAVSAAAQVAVSAPRLDSPRNPRPRVAGAVAASVPLSCRRQQSRRRPAAGGPAASAPRCPDRISLSQASDGSAGSAGFPTPSSRHQRPRLSTQWRWTCLSVVARTSSRRCRRCRQSRALEAHPRRA